MSHKNVIEDVVQYIKEGLQSTWESLWDKYHSDLRTTKSYYCFSWEISCFILTYWERGWINAILLESLEPIWEPFRKVNGIYVLLSSCWSILLPHAYFSLPCFSSHFIVEFNLTCYMASCLKSLYILSHFWTKATYKYTEHKVNTPPTNKFLITLNGHIWGLNIMWDLMRAFSLSDCKTYYHR